MNFTDECCYSWDLTRLCDGEGNFCLNKDAVVECQYKNRWNECPDYKPFRAVMRVIREMKT